MTLTVDLHIGRALRNRRRIVGLSQDSLAAELGVTHQTVNKYETGAIRMSAVQVFRASKVLTMPVSQFFPLDEVVG